MKRSYLITVLLATIVAPLGAGSATAVPAARAPDTVPPSRAPASGLVYVTNSAQLTGTPGIGRFAIAASGALTPVDNVAAPGGARGMVFTPDRRFAYVSAPNTGQIGMYQIAADGALTSLGAVSTPDPFGIAIAPDGRTVYVANIVARTITTFLVGPDGRLVYPRSVDAKDDNPKGVAVTPDGKYLYVSYGVPNDPTLTRLIGFPIQPDGYLGPQPVVAVQVGASGAELVITPNGRFVYVVCQDTDNVFGFRIGANGSLTPVPNSPRPAGNFPEGAVISPDGRRLYVSAVAAPVDDDIPGAVLGFTIGADGSLTATVPPVQMFTPIGLGFAPNGRHLYVSDFVKNSVTTFSVGPAGELTFVRVQGSGATADGASPAFHSVNVLPAG